MDTPLLIAFVLIGLGLLLMLAELFIPTTGVLFVLGIGALIVGLVMTFTSGSHETGLVTLVAVFVAIPLFSTLVLRVWPQTPLGRRLFLANPPEDDTLANMPVNLELENLRGRYGRTVSALRPSGTTEFDGRRIDTVSEGELIEPGRWVVCIDVRAGRVVVRPVDRPPDLNNLETMRFT